MRNFFFDIKYMTVSIQGIKGSYHHQVALNIFGEDTKLLECSNFADIPPQLRQNQSQVGIMAIENSIAGAILPNYNLIDEFQLHITGEYYLPISHQLMALSKQKLQDIKEVWSHPMALEQCRKFFREYPHIKLIEEKDTAEVAKTIQEKQLIGIAAIASKVAAQIYNLEILADNIQTHIHNYTRFVIVQTKPNQTNVSFNKASVRFTLSHETGSLAHILNLFSYNHINLTKIQSLPIIEKPWEYAFFADLTFNNKQDFYQAEKSVKNFVHQWKTLGLYQHRNTYKI
jgi:prephenate dehydratase